MRSFTFERATTPAEAAKLVASNSDARFLAGGTNLLDLMKLGIEQPTHLVDISRLPLKEIQECPGGGLRIGEAAASAARQAQPRRAQRDCARADHDHLLPARARRGDLARKGGQPCAPQCCGVT